MPNDLEYKAMSKVVSNRNKNKKWVKRANDPKRRSLPNDDGTTSTHMMASGELDDNRGFVTPTIIADKSGKLERFEGDERINKAIHKGFKNKEAVVLPTTKFAKYYSKKGYKESTRMNEEESFDKRSKKPKVPQFSLGAVNMATKLASSKASSIGNAISLGASMIDSDDKKSNDRKNLMSNIGAMSSTMSNSFSNKKSNSEYFKMRCGMKMKK